MHRRSLAWLVAALVTAGSTLARADIAPPPPMHLHLLHVSVVAEGTTAVPAEAERVRVAARAALRTTLVSIERCQFERAYLRWGDWSPYQARLRLTWDGTELPVEARVESTTFGQEATRCIADAIPSARITPPPTGRVAVAVTLARDDAY